MQPLRDEKGAHRSHEHHALDTEVQHPRALCEQLAESGEHERGPEGDGRHDHGKNDVRIHDAVPVTGVTAVGTVVTARWRIPIR